MKKLLAAALLIAAGTAPVQALDAIFSTQRTHVRVQTFASGLTHPWGLAFLPDGVMLVTERPGRMRIVGPDGKLSTPLDGLPAVDARRQGGLLDVMLHPEFARNNLVYFSYAEPGEGGSNGTAVARGRLERGGTPRLADVQVIFRQEPKVTGSQGHFGSRLVFDREGKLWVTVGERLLDQYRVRAQTLDNHFGKVLRLNDDGTPAPDNPFIGKADAKPEIWSYGHRNPQGMTIHPETGAIWMHEHGPRGGDAVNIPRKGRNHGWPVATYGTEYSGVPIFKGERYPSEFVEPLHHWTPSIAPSGMAFVSGKAIAPWRGNLLVGALAGERLVRLEVEGEKVVRQEDMLRGLGKRIRDVREGPDGTIFLLTDEPNGSILKLTQRARF
jgi:aldose sugar dehydrogenase